ncbi:hypothetical protein B0H66DRAFT_534829 [Apodospora peruviana]|uniref:Uncharacterized protein n=1 Tax=Apodospora peruviana TaxID=516989 RepID=A0AAE0M3I1_9PEZI|nr:hypothetical protein B0H66DRAFT_534829 [Apodospora peruviana]
MPNSANSLPHLYRYLQRLGIVLGFMQILTCYIIRRELGEAMEGSNPYFHSCQELLLILLAIRTQGQLQQVTSHNNAGICQAYINQQFQCDTVAAFIGRSSNKALISAATHMSRYVDLRAPSEVGQQELEQARAEYGIFAAHRAMRHVVQSGLSQIEECVIG